MALGPLPKRASRSRLVLASAGVSAVLVGMVLAGFGLQPEDKTMAYRGGLDAFVAGLVVILFGLAALAWARWGKSTTSLERRLIDSAKTPLIRWNEQDDSLSPKWRALHLILISFLGLFFELTLIRWLGAEIKVFAYLKNVVLIAAFLGLGLGYFKARDRVGLLPLFLPLSALTYAIVLLGNWSSVWGRTVLPDGESLVLLGLSFQNLNAAPILLRIVSWIPYYATTIVFFLLVTAVFIPLGQYAGKCMRTFAPIRGYSLNLFGSLIGTLLFTGMSYAWMPPGIWFAAASLAAVLQVRHARGMVRGINWALACVFFLMLLVPGDEIWSPYHNLRIIPQSLQTADGSAEPWGYQLAIGSYYYQDLLNLSQSFFAEHPEMPDALHHSEYEVPYAFGRPDRVLVLGAGTGNDVAAALRNGARYVDAVDIDPAILQLGKQYHPEKPYADSRVTLHVNDARAFIRGSSQKYDLVLFGLLDSQQVLSAFGSVRLDNFVYTVEGMRDAYRLVNSNGLMTVTFEVFQPWMADRISDIMREATGQTPTVVEAHHGTVFMVRKGSPITSAEIDKGISLLGSESHPLQLMTGAIPLTTDDWPYLYLRSQELPLAYLTVLPILALMAVAMIRRFYGSHGSIQRSFFFLGAAFMLMEVRVIGQIALLFGSTWIVNAVAITAILVMSILANLLVSVRKFESISIPGALLLLTLLLGSAVPSTLYLPLGSIVGGIVQAMVLALPVFFGSFVFSILFRRTDAPDVALASNLVGAILGGLLEYASLVFGMSSLAWLAGLLYFIAFLPPGRALDRRWTRFVLRR